MSRVLPPHYNPQEVEKRIYRIWEQSGFFNPDNLPLLKNPQGKGLRTKPFTIIMPPPNANGSLHIGHAVGVTLQDIMIRFERMRGKKTLWLPGADHAGFETQVVFDKKLEKEGGNRFEISRNELYREMLAFTRANKIIMENQIRMLGASCDWSREKFTLDDNVVQQTQNTFVALYEKGLIYRGERVVHWCPKHQTALADLETKHIEKKDPLYYLKYGPFEIATARPETKFGDKYVVIHPKDTRYAAYKNGQKISLEWINGPITATIVKDAAIDMNFGTGVMTITPWHDPIDFEIAERHGLNKEQIIDQNGRLLPIAEEFSGMKIMEARPLIVEKLKSKGLLSRIDDTYSHMVAVCYKCAHPIEPQMLPQWFLSMKELAKPALKAVRDGKIKFIPVHFKKTYFHWLKNIHDWNLSQQIMWGIRIPAWFCVNCKEIRINPQVKGNWFFVRHGQTDWNVQKRMQGQSALTSLNETGRKQIRATARELKSHHIDLIISSDATRAKESAEIISHELGGIEIIYDAALRERNYGALEGMTRDDMRKNKLHEIADKLEQYNFKAIPPGGGESIADVETRVSDALARHRHAHAHRNIVVMSHGATLTLLMRQIKNLEFTQLSNLKINNASIIHLAIDNACPKCGSDFIEQDPDVLTTWFSSGQWPYIALGYPDSKTYKNFYPTDVMETGWDILFFWVARMIMLGLWRTKKIPFKTVYLHGLVRDKDRQKMSKSKGNVIDPLGVIELYGADALRFSLIIGNLPGNDIIISEEKIRGYRNFANKIWNATRFVLLYVPAVPHHTKIKYTTAQNAMRARLAKLVRETTQDLERKRFHHAADRLYHFFWHYYADKVIETAKNPLATPEESVEKATAQALILEFHTTLMRLLHPFMPFLTEEIWSYLPSASHNLLMVEPWPQ